MIHKIRKMSGKGDQTVCEWDTETTTADRLAEIEMEFGAMMKRGYIPADLATNELIDKFNPQTDILMIPKMQGGQE